jgi:hypothetical protein
MKLSQFWKHAILLLSVLTFSPLVLAASDDDEAEKKCFKPKFRDFSPADKSEVAPKSAISFHINHLADPLHVKASAKKIPMKVEVVDKKTFFYVKATLPDELTEGYARIHVEAKASEGECIGEDGWLLKINSGAPEKTANASPEKITP